MAVQVLSKRSALLSQARAPYLSDKERAQVTELLARLEAKCEADVRRVILYGSKARGDFDAESDVDLLIAARQGEKRTTQVVEDLQRNLDFHIYPTVFSSTAYEHYRRLKMPFYVNLRRDGIELWDESERVAEELEAPLDFQAGAFRPLDDETREVIRIYVERAREEWEIADLLREKGTLAGAVHSGYNAVFHIATAALYTVNVVRGKHQAVPSAIRKFLVEPGLIEAEFLAMYRSLMRGGEVVEYSGKRGFALRLENMRLSDEERAKMFSEAERFIARFEQFLRERGAVMD